MNEFKIVGESKPSKVKLKSNTEDGITELSKRSARLMFENGIIKISNPDTLYYRI